MQVLLRQDIEKLGKSGDVVKVKDGYARNFLLPKGLVLEATKSNLAIIELQKKQKQLKAEKQIKEAKKLADRLAKVSCTVVARAMEDDKLYGNIIASDIAKALEIEGIKIDKELIRIDKPVDKLGIYEVDVVLHPEVRTKVRVWVTKK